jgi:hypothetical protein
MALSVTHVPTRVLTDAGGATTTISFGSLPAVGSGILIWYVNGVAAIPILDPTIADNQGAGHVYLKAKAVTESNSGQMAAAWYLPKILASSGTFTITITHNAGSNNYSLVNIAEVTTGGGGITLDQSTSGTTTTGSPLTATTGTTTAAAEVVATAMTVDGTQSNQGIGTGLSGGTQVMVEQNDTLHISGAGDYVVVSSTGTQTMSYAISAAHVDAAGVIATFSEVSAVGTTNSGAASSTGAATAIAVGAANASAAARSIGVSTAIAVGASSASSVMSASGVGVATAAGAGLFQAAASSTGVATDIAVGASAASGNALSSGVSTAQSTGTSTASGVMNALGVSTAIAVGAATGTAAGDAYSAGASTAIAVGASTGGDVAAVVVAASVPEGGGVRPRNPWEERKKKRDLEIEIEDAEIMQASQIFLQQAVADYMRAYG